MSTITLWLLVTSAYGYQGSNGGVSTVAQFATVDECQRVGTVVRQLSSSISTKCIQATVVKP